MTMFLQEQLLRIDSFSYGVEWCTWRFLTGKTSSNCHEFIKSPDLRNMQLTFDCTQTNNLPGASYTCKGLSRWNWSIEPSTKPIKKPSFQHLPASQSMVTVITLCFSTNLHRFFSCVSKAQVAYSDVKHKVTEAGTFQGEMTEAFFCTKNAPRPRTAMTGSWRPEISWDWIYSCVVCLLQRDA